MGLPIAARALLIAGLIFCFRDASAQDIRIAVAGSMTGSLAEAGDQVKRGAEMAAKDINEAGGVNGRKIVLTIEDDACDPKQAVSVANHVSRRTNQSGGRPRLLGRFHPRFRGLCRV